MSQRLFRKGNLEAFAGWDPPLQYFFLCIERRDARDEDPDGGYVFNNLRRKNPAMTLVEIADELARAGMAPPPTFLDDLEGDRLADRSNLRKHYGEVE